MHVMYHCIMTSGMSASCEPVPGIQDERHDYLPALPTAIHYAGLWRAKPETNYTMPHTSYIYYQASRS